MPEKKTETQTPTKTDVGIDPEPLYNPERLCPTQRSDSERHSRP